MGAAHENVERGDGFTPHLIIPSQTYTPVMKHIHNHSHTRCCLKLIYDKLELRVCKKGEESPLNSFEPQYRNTFSLSPK